MNDAYLYVSMNHIDVTSGIPNLITLDNKKQERATAQKQQQQMRQ